MVARRLTVAQATVLFLQQQWSERDGTRRRLVQGMCGIFGHGNVAGMGQGLDESGADLPFYPAKNEQAMVHMAIGFAKAHRRFSTLACTASIGPGSTNMLTGAATATVNRVPVLLFPSDSFAHRRTGVVLQQLEHAFERDLTVNDAFRPLSVFFDRVVRPEQLLTALPEAMRALLDQANAGAVVIALPQDVQGEAYDFPERFFAERGWRVARAAPDPQDLAAAVEALRSAKRPLLVAGGGVRYAEAEATLRGFVERFGVPVGETFAGKGVIGESAYLLGGFGLTGTAASAEMARQADTVVCIGTRLSDFATGSRSMFDPEARFIGINVSAFDAHKMGAIAVVADARLALEALGDGLATAGWRTADSYRREVGEAIAGWSDAYGADIRPRQGERMSQGEIVALVNGSALKSDVVVAAAGTPPGEILKGWSNSAGSECLLEFGYSCMGHEIPAAMGVRLARGPVGEIFVIIGDGTYLMMNGELMTAAQEGLKITVIVVDNGGFQCIRDLQEATTGTPDFGNEFRAREPRSGRLDGPYVDADYALNAQSLGCLAMHAESAAALQQALEDARRQPRPAVIVCPAERHRKSIGPGIWWDLGIAEVSQREAVRKIRHAHDEGRRAQVYHG